MAGSTTVYIDANEFPVSSVVVFRTQAEVTRSFPIELQARNNDLEIKGLPNSIQHDSLRIQGVGKGVTLLDHALSSSPSPFRFGANETTKVKELRALKKAAEAELKILSAQSEILQGYSKSMTAEHVKPEAFIEYLGVFSKAGIQNVDGTKQKEKEIEEIDAQIKKELEVSRTSSERNEHLRGTIISVVLHSETDLKAAELKIIYVVNGASWTPAYEIRASTDTNGQLNKTVALHYKAAVTQTTGEDWKDTKLTLNTTSPALARILLPHTGLKIQPGATTDGQNGGYPNKLNRAGLSIQQKQQPQKQQPQTQQQQTQQQQQQMQQLLQRFTPQQLQQKLLLIQQRLAQEMAQEAQAQQAQQAVPHSRIAQLQQIQAQIQAQLQQAQAHASFGTSDTGGDLLDLGGLLGQAQQAQQAVYPSRIAQLQQAQAQQQQAPTPLQQAPAQASAAAFGGFGSTAPSAAAFGAVGAAPAGSSAFSFGTAAPANDKPQGFSAAVDPAVIDEAAAFNYADAVAESTAVSATYKIEGKTTILSGIATHKVVISTSIVLPIEVYVVTMPRVQPWACLQAKIKNARTEPLLAGLASIFNDDSYVSSTQLPLVSPGDSFICSLGMDDKIKVSFTHTDGKTVINNVPFVGNTESVLATNAIKVKNNRSGAISRLIIRDAVPVGQDPLKVLLKTPAELATVATADAEGAIARWSKERANNREEGLVEWVLDNIESGEEKKVELAWSVEVPQGIKWSYSV
ncbi:hypothetical protein FRC04_005483 [Tulasnella sp. 424]|nr:hypothetical protein FRC04_005483 [Tulasnella sp. 424]KAG8962252.1 hypothetical protein FRC05_005473 [Tulasnella sp. 425]